MNDKLQDKFIFFSPLDFDSALDICRFQSFHFQTVFFPLQTEV